MAALFQSTHPHRVRLLLSLLNTPSIVFQSTHPHRVRQENFDFDQLLWEFQSTHPHRVRQKQQFERLEYECFNPRTRIGCDQMDVRENFQNWVSIHAPAWGATGLDVLPFYALQFQSTHPHGVRLLSLPKLLRFILFQSTHPHGVRPSLKIRRTKKFGFNPRTRMGCD